MTTNPLIDVEDPKLHAPAGLAASKQRGLTAFAGRAARDHPRLTAWFILSVSLAVVLAIDPLWNQPAGLITLSLLTGRPSGHGPPTPCNYDYEGSWEIGVLQGPTPSQATSSSASVLSCASVGNSTPSSYVAEPSLVVPHGELATAGRLYAFYQVKSLATGNGVIGVGQSLDAGQTWEHVGVALSADYSLTSPWVGYDHASGMYVLIPDTHKAWQHSIQLWTTSPAEFPFGWRQLSKSPASGEHFLDTTAVFFQGQWWMFTTVKNHWRWGEERSYSLLLYHTSNLTGEWVQHPMSPITSDLRYARGGGRPFVYAGSLYRWAQDDSDWFGAELHLLKVTILTADTYMEIFNSSLLPSGTGNWISARTHHVDIQPIGPNGTWLGLVDGDKHKDGSHHFYKHEAHFVRFKNSLLKALVFQMLIVAMAHLIKQSGGQLAHWISTTAWYKAASKGQTGIARVWFSVFEAVLRILPEMQLLSIMTIAFITVLVVFAAVPQIFICPRSAVKVAVANSPPVTHVDHAAPYDVSDLMVVTGATASFFDRLSNMVGSMHAWEPTQRIAVYDLGFSESQLAKMMCWQNVEVRRFPYERYPEHVRDVRNYAFKTLILQHALETSSAVLWIDSGLELRTDMTTMRSWLAQYGHVSALQEDSIGDDMYTHSETMAHFLGLGENWETMKKWQFCAGGLQGFVRDSDAHRLVLNPVANCSLHQKECIAPEGSSRLNHNFDQTALTIMIWHHNFSCLPRETHCMWSVKKASRDPLTRSDPIEVVSRGHRLPKPYGSYITQRQGCIADKSKVPWPAMSTERQESLSRYNLTFKISRIYLQPIGDEVVQCLSCVGAHAYIQALYWLQLAVVGAGVCCGALRKTWTLDPARLCLHLVLGSGLLLGVQVLGFYAMSHIR